MDGETNAKFKDLEIHFWKFLRKFPMMPDENRPKRIFRRFMAVAWDFHVPLILEKKTKKKCVLEVLIE